MSNAAQKPTGPVQPAGAYAGALMMAARGFKVFRLLPGDKKPLAAGINEATTDPEIIEGWWTDAPKLNFGIALGAGHVGVDCDLYKATGTADHASLGEIPQTLTIESPRGGRHYIFRHGDVAQTKPAPTIDIKSAGGYLVCVGSTFEGKRYRFLDDAEPAECPPHIAARFGVRAERSADSGTIAEGAVIDSPWALARAEAYLTTGAPLAIEGQSGDDTTIVVANRLFDFGLSADVALELMLTHWNERCTPAWDDNRLEYKIASALRSRIHPVGRDQPTRHFQEIPPGEGPRSEPGPRLIRISSLAGKPVPPREWHTPGLIPASNATLLFGDGATGKSLLGAQLAVATVLHRTWIAQTITKPGPALYVGAEDDEDEMHRRFDALAAEAGAKLSDLHDLHLFCLAGHDAILGAVDRNEIVKPTALWTRINEMIMDLKPSLVVYDTLADLFAGNENSRGQARQFIGQLRRPAIVTKSSALLLAHPSLSGMASGTGTSGSTGWSNSVRSRLYLSRVFGGEERSEADPDVRTLRVMKTNYAGIGDELKVRWQNGAFVPDVGKPASVVAEVELRAEQVFLGLLGTYNSEGRNVSCSKNQTYAPKVFAADQRAGGIFVKEFEGAMNRLFGKKRIRMEEFGPPSRRRSKLACS